MLHIQISDPKGSKCKCGSTEVEAYMEASFDDDAPCEAYDFCNSCLHETIDDLKDLD